MRYIFVVTSSSVDEFAKWQYGQSQTECQHTKIITCQGGHLTVKDGRHFNTQDKKAQKTFEWVDSNLKNNIHPSRLGLMVHGQEDLLDNIVKICSENCPDLATIHRDYYTSTQKNDEQYKLMRNFRESGHNITDLVNSLIVWLWKETPEQKGEEACRLRAEILTPLVARDLIQQAVASGKFGSNDVSTDLIEQIAEAVKNLNDPIDKFCSMASINCDCFREKLQKLCELSSASEQQPLRNTFHDELKKVAEQMEAQIEAIGG